MATGKEWEKFFITQKRRGTLDRTVRHLGKLPALIFMEFEGLSAVYSIAKSVQKRDLREMK